jgi:hypothetical protein
MNSYPQKTRLHRGVLRVPCAQKARANGAFSTCFARNQYTRVPDCRVPCLDGQTHRLDAKKLAELKLTAKEKLIPKQPDASPLFTI